MKTRKTTKTDLEKKRNVFFQIGIIVALSAVFVAFEWKCRDTGILDMGFLQIDNIDEEIIPITEFEQKALPPPPRPVIEFKIVKNDVKIIDDIIIQPTEINPTNTIIVVPLPDEKIDEIVPFYKVEEKPSFGSGEAGLFKFLTQNIQYPPMAIDAGISGTVYITFVIDKTGAVTDAVIERGIGGGCDEEALRVVRLMPKWNPGKQRGKPVPVPMTLPVKFVAKR